MSAICYQIAVKVIIVYALEKYPDSKAPDMSSSEAHIAPPL